MCKLSWTDTPKSLSFICLTSLSLSDLSWDNSPYCTDHKCMHLHGFEKILCLYAYTAVCLVLAYGNLSPGLTVSVLPNDTQLPLHVEGGDPT